MREQRPEFTTNIVSMDRTVGVRGLSLKVVTEAYSPTAVTTGRDIGSDNVKRTFAQCLFCVYHRRSWSFLPVLIVDIKEFFNNDDSAQDPSSISRRWLYTCSLGSIQSYCSHPTVIHSYSHPFVLSGYTYLLVVIELHVVLLVLQYFVPATPTSVSLSEGYTTQPGTSRQ